MAESVAQYDTYLQQVCMLAYPTGSADGDALSINWKALECFQASLANKDMCIQVINACPHQTAEAKEINTDECLSRHEARARCPLV
jgi:hypothetical protein